MSRVPLWAESESVFYCLEIEAPRLLPLLKRAAVLYQTGEAITPRQALYFALRKADALDDYHEALSWLVHLGFERCFESLLRAGMMTAGTWRPALSERISPRFYTGIDADLERQLMLDDERDSKRHSGRFA